MTLYKMRLASGLLEPLKMIVVVPVTVVVDVGHCIVDLTSYTSLDFLG